MDILAHAKINLGLQIVRRRDDGYHDIDTIFHRVDIADRLSFSRRERGITLSCSDPALPTDGENLCIRAAQSLFDHTGYDGGVHLSLEKTIPTGAGLGGGSADAAAVLRALPAFLDLAVAPSDLRDIAAALGADVPFFLEDASAYARGRGDILSCFDLALPYWIAVVYPDVQVSTAWAYGAFRFNPSLPIIDLRHEILGHLHHPAHLVNRVRNDFEPVVFHRHEEILRIKEILYRTGAAFALMSGSGSSVFGLYADEDEARESCAFFQRRYSAFLTPPLWKPAA